jgi:uncharacterized membrane protein YqiK
MTGILIFLATTLIATIAIWKNRYIKVPKDKVMVVYGRVDKPNKDGIEIIDCGRGKFVKPIVQDYEFLDLAPISCPIEASVESRDKFDIDVHIDTLVSISSDPDLLSRAAIMLLGKEKNEIRDIAKDLICKQIKYVFNQKDLVDLSSKQKDTLLTELADGFRNELRNIGLELVYIKINGLKSPDNLIHQLESDIQEAKLLGAQTGVVDQQALIELNKAIELNGKERAELLKKKIILLSKFGKDN